MRSFVAYILPAFKHTQIRKYCMKSVADHPGVPACYRIIRRTGAVIRGCLQLLYICSSISDGKGCTMPHARGMMYPSRAWYALLLAL